MSNNKTFRSLEHFRLPQPQSHSHSPPDYNNDNDTDNQEESAVTAAADGAVAMSSDPPPVFRERRPSAGAPISDLRGPIGPAGVTRPKHKRTFTGFGAGDIKIVEGRSTSFLLRSRL